MEAKADALKLWLLVSLVALANLLGGCATPVGKSEVTPTLYPTAEKNIAVSVIEARAYVLSGNKSPKYEGLIRDGFGIPHTVYRPRRPEAERFVDMIAGMIQDGLTANGAKVTVVSVPVGATVEDTWKKLSDTGAGRYIVVRVVESNWQLSPFRERASYSYDFSLLVGGPGGFQTQAKRFAAAEENEKSQQYNVFDMHSVRYRRVIESMFADPVIQQALQK